MISTFQPAIDLSKVLIRRLVAADLPALEWEGQYTHFRRMYQDALRRQERSLAVLWVAEEDQRRLVAQVFIQLICDRKELANGVDRAYLYGFRTRPEYRSHGLGTRMEHAVEEDLILRGFTSLTLNVAKENLRAMQLYERLGFQIVAHEPGIWSYIDHHGVIRRMNEPAWRMEKLLRH